MKILVTGGTGFLGSHLVNRLAERYPDTEDNEIITLSRHRHPEYNIYSDRPFAIYVPIGHDNISWFHRGARHFAVDLSCKNSVSKLFQYFKPEIIFHLAANPNGRPDPNNPDKIIDDNIKATFNLCQYCPPKTKIIFASTIVVYGNQKPGEIMTEQSMTKPTSLYAISKLASEGILRFFEGEGKITSNSLRIPATVGSGLTHGILFDFIKKLKSKSEKLDVLGDAPGSTKPYCHVSDIVSAFMQCINGPLSNRDIVNIVPHDNLNVEQIAHTVMKELKIYKDINWLGNEANWKSDNNYIKASNTLANYMGFGLKYKYSKDAIQQAVRDIINESE